MATKKEPKTKPTAPAKPAAAKAKDLPAKKNAKGGIGGWATANHNETLA